MITCPTCRGQRPCQHDMIPLPPRPTRPKRRQTELLDVVQPILVALNSMPGVWACQNKDIRRAIPGKGWISLGPCLGEGSADVVFTVVVRWLQGWPPIAYETARIGWLECKTAAKRTKTKANAARDEHQASWARAMRNKGHFVAHGVATVEEARMAVERCRAGKNC